MQTLHDFIKPLLPLPWVFFESAATLRRDPPPPDGVKADLVAFTALCAGFAAEASFVEFLAWVEGVLCRVVALLALVALRLRLAPLELLTMGVADILWLVLFAALWSMTFDEVLFVVAL